MNSSQNKLIGIAIVILLILSLTFLAINKSRQSNNENATELTQNTSERMVPVEKMEKQGSTLTGSFMDLMNTGESLQCEYSSSTEGMSMTGTSYIADNKMRSDMDATLADGNTVNTYMIVDGEWIYSWTNLTKQGVKINSAAIKDMEADVNESMEATPAEKENTAIKEFQKNYSFNCNDWNADERMFTVPTDVTFTDFSSMMEGKKMDPCAACDYMQDADSKSQCLAALKCTE